MRILVIQTAFIGDVVLTTPFLRALQKRWPSAEVHVVSTPQGCQVLAGLDGIVCHALDKRGKSVRESVNLVLESLGKQSFDLVFSVHRSLRSLWIGKQVKAEKRIAFSSFFSTILGYQTASYPPYSDETHYSQKPFALFSVVDGDSTVFTNLRPSLGVLTTDQSSLVGRFPVLCKNNGYIVLSPFSAWGTKMWFADRFTSLGVQLSKKYGLPIIIIGTSGSKQQGCGFETAIASTMASKISKEGGTVINLLDQSSIGELKALIKGASLLIANDSAPVHIASAFDVPTVAILGPTVKKWGFWPLSSRAVVVEKSDVGCRPCHLHGPPRCPKRHFRCMNEINVEDVVKAVEKLI